jgi:hypothetical protein
MVSHSGRSERSRRREKGMKCWLGALTTGPTVRLLHLMSGSRSGLAAGPA